MVHCLQTCCFMKLINDFETFPTESLSLLPLRLRYELIKNLPAADVCQLEQSSFVKGLDMEKVWAAIGRMFGLSKTLNQSKDHFFSEVCKIIFNFKSNWDRITRILLLLFSNNHCLGHGDQIGNPFSRYLDDAEAVACYNSLHHRKTVLQLPQRCQKEYSSCQFGLSNPAECIRLVLEKTQYHPQALEINDAYEFYERFLSTPNSPWLEKGDCHQLFVEYLSDVRYLTISLRDSSLPYHGIEENINKVIPFIMQVLSYNSPLHLKELSIMNQAYFLESTVFTISPYLKKGVVTTPRECIALESLSIKSSYVCAVGDAAVLELAEIIESQTTLCRLSLVLPHNNIYPSIGRLCTTLAGFFRQPQFCEMEIVIPIPFTSFQEIIHSFMAVQRGEDCSLRLGGFVVKDNQSVAIDFSCSSPPQENIIHKTLILGRNVHLPHTTQWLHEHVVLRLKELRLQLDFHGRSPSLLLSHPRMEVERLSLTISHCPLVDQNYDNLLQGVHLKHLLIDMDAFALINIPSLVRGLHKQAQLGSLESLQIRDESGNYPEDDITQLFSAIVSLPQLENFTLYISYNNFNDQHVAIMYMLWKKMAGGKKFKRLCLGPFSQALSILQNITQELVNKEY